MCKICTIILYQKAYTNDTGVSFVFTSYLMQIFIYLIYFLAVLGLHWCMGFSLVMEKGGYSLIVMRGFLIAVTSFVAERRLRVCGLQ